VEFYLGDGLLSYFIIDDRYKLAGMVTIVISGRDRDTERFDSDYFSLSESSYLDSLSYLICREEVYIHS
jgi:hypothetical protein